MLTKKSVNYSETRIVLNRELYVASKRSGGLSIRAKIDSSLLKSIDNKQKVKPFVHFKNIIRWTFT